jgi:hypothetical protein
MSCGEIGLGFIGTEADSHFSAALAFTLFYFFLVEIRVGLRRERVRFTVCS